MTGTAQQTTFRILKSRRQGDLPKKYRYTFEVIDEGTEQRLAICDLVGHACFAKLNILDKRNQAWKMKPNRPVMPSRWSLIAPDGRVAMQIHQNIPARLFNPLGRVALTLRDASGSTRFRVMDTSSGLLDRIFGSGPNEWAIVENKQTVARLTRLPRKGEAESAPGLLGKLKRFVKGSDQAIVSLGSAPVLTAPVALGMVMILNELTDSSGA